jgi:glycosyltransferase involved in cell wall biosynthesis
MQCPTLKELPPPPPGKVGWPWTQTATPLPQTMLDSLPWPGISIVTPSYNQGQFIEETIRSVLLQRYPNLEFIIVDGGSTDHSLEVIKKYERWLTHWVSEPDRGQAHAINKGLECCTGRIFNWINSDDILAPGALETVARLFNRCDGVAGTVLNFDDKGHRMPIRNRALRAPALIRQAYWTSYHQPGVWLSRENVALCGGLDESYDFVFDWNLIIRYLARFPAIRYTNDLLVYFRFHEGSKTVQKIHQFENERIRALQKIAQEDSFRHLHSCCALRIRKDFWREHLEAALRSREHSTIYEVFQILAGVLTDPLARVTRRTAGAVVQLIRGRQDH